jgi:hypothetical protein
MLEVIEQKLCVQAKFPIIIIIIIKQTKRRCNHQDRGRTIPLTTDSFFYQEIPYLCFVLATATNSLACRLLLKSRWPDLHVVCSHSYSTYVCASMAFAWSRSMTSHEIWKQDNEEIIVV